MKKGGGGGTFLSNAPQFPKENCFLDGSQAAFLCFAGKNNMYVKINVEQWLNDTDRIKPKYSQ